MRTTLAIDDDVLAAARLIGAREGRQVGAVVSDLARQGLQAPAAGVRRNGLPVLPVRAGAARVTLEMVNALRDAAV